MSIPQNMARDFLATGATDLQDAYRIAWMKGIPPEFRKARVSKAVEKSQIASGKRLAETNKARSKSMVSEQSRKIMPLHRKGMTVAQIAEVVGNGPVFVRKVIRLNGCQPNKSGPYGRTKKDYSVLFPRARAMRDKGIPWQDIGLHLGVSKTNLRNAYNAWMAAK